MGAKKDFTKNLLDAQAERDKLKTQVDALTELRVEHTDKLKAVADELAKTQKSDKESQDEIGKLKTQLATLKAENSDLKKKEDGKGTAVFDWKSPWLWTVIAVSVAIVLAGVLMFRTSKATEDFIDDHPPTGSGSSSSPPDDFKDPPEGTNTN
jgi:hypothetical protein